MFGYKTGLVSAITTSFVCLALVSPAQAKELTCVGGTPTTTPAVVTVPDAVLGGEQWGTLVVSVDVLSCDSRRLRETVTQTPATEKSAVSGSKTEDVIKPGRKKAPGKSFARKHRPKKRGSGGELVRRDTTYRSSNQKLNSGGKGVGKPPTPLPIASPYVIKVSQAVVGLHAKDGWFATTQVFPVAVTATEESTDEVFVGFIQTAAKEEDNPTDLAKTTKMTILIVDGALNIQLTAA